MAVIKKALEMGEAAGKDEVTEEILKGRDDVVVDWICKLCNTPFESGVVAEDLRFAVIVPAYKDKGDMINV